MKIIVTNMETNEQAVLTDMYLWFLLWEQMKSYEEDTANYKIDLIQD